MSGLPLRSRIYPSVDQSVNEMEWRVHLRSSFILTSVSLLGATRWYYTLPIGRTPPLGKHSFKKIRNFMKTFHKTATPPPRTAFMKSLFGIFDRISGTYVVLNKRYEIRLTPPPRL